MMITDYLTPNTMIYILFGVITLVSWIVQKSLESKFKKYSQQPLPYTGKQVAEMMLRDNGITDVEVVSVAGHLTDHFNPTTKQVNLSESVFNQANVAAAAVAAHECGHAVQHATDYGPLRLRSALVPVVSISSKWMPWILLIGILLINYSVLPLEIGIALFATTTLFSFITLPVEVDASRRAIAWLEQAGITDSETTPMAKSALHSAAHTYVVAAISSLATLLYYIFILLGRRR